jgi:hypothetical protein
MPAPDVWKTETEWLCQSQTSTALMLKSKTTTSAAHIEMLLDDYENLRNGTLMLSSASSGTPDPQSVLRSSKKLVLPLPRSGSLPPCKGVGCGSLDVIEDVTAGSVVCTQCGLIQSTSVFESARTDAIFHQGVSRIVVHRYSRIPYLRGCLKSLCGETQIDLSPEASQALRSFFLNVDHPSGFLVKKAIVRLKLPKRLLYHAHTIAFQLFRSSTPNPSGAAVTEVFRLFRVLESAWDRSPLGGSIRKGRKKFLSYPLVWNQLCLQLGFCDMADIMPPLRNKRLIHKQQDIFNQLVDFINE